MRDLAQDVAEDVLGAAKDGRFEVLIVKVLIFSIVICQLRTGAQHTRIPTLALQASSPPQHAPIRDSQPVRIRDHNIAIKNA